MPYNNSHIKGWLRIIIFVIAYFFIGFFFYYFNLLVTGIDSDSDIDNITTRQRIIGLIIESFSIFCVIWVLLKFVDLETFVDIGFRLKNRAKDIFAGLLAGAIIMGFGLLFLLSINQIEYVSYNFDFKSLAYLFCLYTLVSFKEELLLRGYVLRNLSYSFGKPIGLITSAFIFSIMHGMNPHFDYLAFINLFLAGIFLGLPYVYTKNLWFPIALHFSWNFFQSFFGFNVSGLNSYSLIEFNIPDSNIINGGDFGFEGSILSIIVQITAIFCLYHWYENCSKESNSKKLDLLENRIYF